MFVGMICLLVPSIIIVARILNVTQQGNSIDWNSALHLYRSSLLIILEIIFVGLNTYVWSHFGVNHILIFEIDPRQHLTFEKLLELGCFLLVVWLLSFLGFLVASFYEVHPFAQPLSLTIFLLLLLFNPLKVFYFRSRRWLLKNVLRVCLAPFYPVNFTDFWLGDQFTSLETIFSDISFVFCFYIYGTDWNSVRLDEQPICSGWSQYPLQTVLTILPSWFRLAQCLRRFRDTRSKFPHLHNAGKYASGIFLAIANGLRRSKLADKPNHPFLYVWICFALFSSTYKLIWDFKMDWGLFDKNSKHRFLRQQLVYSSISFYYAAMIQNLVFRYIWILNILPYFSQTFSDYSDLLAFVLAIIELFRRFIWNFFRLENEHVNNCGEFRAVREISIQMATSVASGYTKHLETIAEQSINDDEMMIPMTVRRRTTIRSPFFGHDNSYHANDLTAVELKPRGTTISDFPDILDIINSTNSQQDSST